MAAGYQCLQAYSNNPRNQIIKKWIPIAVFPIAAGLWIFALLSKPTLSDADSHYKIMTSDLEKIIAAGDVVVETTGNSKLGGAYLAKGVRWGGQTYRTYEVRAESLGWRRRPSTEIQYCKNGMLLEVKKDGRSNNGENVLFLVMTFNDISLRSCAELR